MARKSLKPKKPDNRPRWTPKQVAFVHWYTSAECYGNGVESARRSGYAGNDVTLAAVAYGNINKPHIAAEIKKRQDKALAAANITVEKVLRDLESQRMQAQAAGQIAPAVRCSELQGKYLKMFVEKIEHVQTVEDVPTLELVRLLEELAEAAGIDLVTILTGNGSGNGVLPGGPGAPTAH